MKPRLLFFGIVVLITLLYAGGCRRAGAWLVKDDKPTHADAMVLLMGGIADRVMQAADLYNQGTAERLIIVEENMGPYRKLEARGINIISTTEQVCDAAVILGIPAEKITVLSGDARSTQSEAIAVRNYLISDAETDTLILVSSASHTRRASMIFKAAFKAADRPMQILCSPSAYTDFDGKHWWRSKEGIQAVIGEYIKMANLLLFERRKL